MGRRAERQKEIRGVRVCVYRSERGSQTYKKMVSLRFHSPFLPDLEH